MTLASPWRYRRYWLPDLAVVVILAALTQWAFVRFPLDLAVQSRFFREGQWVSLAKLPWSLSYQYAGLALAATAGVALVVLVLGAIRPPLARFRVHCLFVILTIAVAPGIVINLLLKEHWGRPRPKEVAEFGGRLQHLAPCVRGQGGRGKSFPCGHSSVGFSLCVLYFLFRRRRPGAACLLLLLAALSGLLMGIGRMSAGAHFLSDVLWSAYIVFGIALALYHFVLRIPAREDAGAGSHFSRAAWALTVACVLGITAGGAMAAPYFEWIEHGGTLAPDEQRAVTIRCEKADVEIEFGEGNRFSVYGAAEGFGCTQSRLSRRLETDDGTLIFESRPKGLFTEFVARLRIAVPEPHTRSLDIEVGEGDVVVRADHLPGVPVTLRVSKGSVTVPASWVGGPAVIEAPEGEIRYE